MRVATGEVAVPPDPTPDIPPEQQCHQCHEHAHRYRCPACDMRTCSLACTKAHKQEKACTGKRSRTEMVTLSDFTERQLLSDYKFLEEAARLHDVAQRSEAPRPARQLPLGLQNFVDEAQRRGIKYELLPPGMQRRKQNSSRFDRRSRTIFWHIHWHFPAAKESVHDLRVSEQTPLKQILQQHISLAPGNSVKRHALRLYVEAGLENLQILMKKEHCPANKSEFHQLDIDKFLRQQLSGKAVVEFPVLIVLLPEEEKKYSIMQDAADVRDNDVEEAPVSTML